MREFVAVTVTAAFLKVNDQETRELLSTAVFTLSLIVNALERRALAYRQLDCHVTCICELESYSRSCWRRSAFYLPPFQAEAIPM